MSTHNLFIHSWFKTTSNFLVCNLQLPCVQPPTSLCMYNLHLPCVQPPTSLCTTTNFLIKPSNCSAFWTLLGTLGAMALLGTLGTLGTLVSEWVLKITKSAQSSQKCPECRAIWWFYEEVGCCTQGRWRLYTRKVEVVHKEVGGCTQGSRRLSWIMNEWRGYMWTSCRGFMDILPRLCG